MWLLFGVVSLLSFSSVLCEASGKTAKINQIIMPPPPTTPPPPPPPPCNDECGPTEICNEQTNQCVCNILYIEHEGMCLPRKHYGEQCMIQAQCVGSLQICNETTGRCDCVAGTVYNETEEECGLPCWYRYGISSDSGRLYHYGGDANTATYADAQGICQADGGYLITFLSHQDEVDYANYKLEVGASMNQRVWMDLQQVSQHVYHWGVVDITFQVNNDTGEAYNGEYSHFDSNHDVDRTSYEQTDCFFENGRDDFYSWEESSSCTTLRSYMCECPSREKYTEVFIKGNKAYLYDPQVWGLN